MDYRPVRPNGRHVATRCAEFNAGLARDAFLRNVIQQLAGPILTLVFGQLCEPATESLFSSYRFSLLRKRVCCSWERSTLAPANSRGKARRPKCRV